MSLVREVSALLQEATADLVLPRFRALDAASIASKATDVDPDDVVTVVDHEVEARLEEALPKLLPGSTVLGEEAASKSPALLDRLAGLAPVWVIDPLDGTKNFVRGEDTFGTIVALVERGETKAAWIVLPVRNQVFSAERGRGAEMNGTRVRVPPRPNQRLEGKIYTRFMPPDVAADLKRRTHDRYDRRPILASSAIEYTDTILGRQDFVIYYRLLPWDHAAGALLLTEAGGAVVHMSGTPYAPSSHDQVTIVAASVAAGGTVRTWIR